MRYSSSAEVDTDALSRVLRISNIVDMLMIRELSAPPFDSIDIEIGYVPIIMSDSGKDWYKTRTKISKKNNLLDSAPRLRLETFISDSEEKSVRVYLDGLRSDVPRLMEIGLSSDDVERLLKAINKVEREVVSKLTELR